MASITLEDVINQLKYIKNIPTSVPQWLTTSIGEIHAHHKKFRSILRENKLKWSYEEYSENLVLHYYKLALMHYQIFYDHKINLKSAKTILGKCLDALQGIRHLQSEKRIGDLQSSVFKLNDAVNRIYTDIETKMRGFDSKHHKAELIVTIGTSEDDKLDLSTATFEKCHSKLFCIKMIDFVSEIEEIFSQDLEKNHSVKSDLCVHLAEAYNLCNLQEVCDYYTDISNKQLEIFARKLVTDDESKKKQGQVQCLIKKVTMDHRMSLDQVKSVVLQTYTDCPNYLEDSFIEQKYKKYLLKNYLNELDGFIETMIALKSQAHFKEVLLILDKIKSTVDIPSFFQGDYYRLLLDHISLLIGDEEQEFIKKVKLKCWNAVIPYAVSAQKEAAFLKHIILYIRSASDPRLTTTNLKIQQFCDLTLSTEEFIVNILSLKERTSRALRDLQSTAYAIVDRTSLFLMAKFVEVLHPYAFPVQPTIERVNDRYVIELKGSLIILSEVYEEVLRLKTPKIQELHLEAADIHIDIDLMKKDWSGINILIVSQFINIHGERTWDIGGWDGKQHNDPAANGIRYGEDGTNGIDGFAGQSGGNIFISCREMINSEKLTLKSIGGNGGNGQAGGNGMRGKNGESINLANFKPLVTPLKPHHRILDQIEVTERKWSNNVASGHKYIRGTTFNKQTLTYSYYAKRLLGNREQYLLFEGSHGLSGGQAGVGGYGGSVGYAGEICIDCSQAVAVNIDNIPVELKSGDPGKNGNSGEPGSNGSDMGHLYVNRWLSKINENIGTEQGSKIMRKYYKRRNEKNYVYCSFRENCNEEDCYVELVRKSNKQSVYERYVNDRRDERKQTHAEAVRVNAISSKVIEQRQEVMADDIIDMLSNLQKEFRAINDNATEAICIGNDEQTTTEMTELQIRRLAVLNQTKCNRQTFKKKIDSAASIDISSLIQDVISNPKNVNPWFKLRHAHVKYEYFTQLFSILKTHRAELNNHFGEIYCFLVEKYKYAICNRIASLNVSLNKTDKLTLDPVGNFLKHSTTVQDFTHEDLGVLNDFFRNTNKEQLENLINYSKQLSLGSILYPIKYFLMEKCHKDEQFQRKSEHFTTDLETFHSRLERLMTCYQIALVEDRDSAILDEIKRKKLEIENNFATSDPAIIAEFYEHIRQHGVSSTSVRELLAYIFDCSIKIFVPNEHMQLILHHDHNPSASNQFYLLLQNGGCTQLVADSDYKELVLERKNTGKYYSSVSSRVDQFVSKRQFNEFYEDLSMIAIKDVGHDCEYCHSEDKDTLLQLLLQYFPELSEAKIKTQINKLARKVVEGKGFLCALLREFDVASLLGIDQFACERKLIVFLENASLIDIKLDVTTPHNCAYCQKRSDSKLIQLLLQHFPVTSKVKVEAKLNKLTTKYIKDKSVLCTLLKRFDVEGVQVSYEELSYFVNAVLKSIVNNHTDTSIFQWIFTAYPQEKWLNEIFYLELQNYFRSNLHNASNLIKHIRNTKQKDMLLLMQAKLCDDNDKADFDCIAKCLNIMNETCIDIELVQTLPLSKWPYVFREQYLEYKLCEITEWEMEDLQRAMHYLIKLECHFGLDIIDEFVQIMLEKRSWLTSDILLKFLTVLHNQEWSLNKEMLDKFKLWNGHNIEEILGNLQDIDDERSLDKLLNLINGNSNTSPEIVELINTFRNHPCFTVNKVNKENITAKDIEKWSKEFKTVLSKTPEGDKQKFIDENTTTFLSQIFLAIKLKRGFLLTKTQLIAILLLLKHNHSTLAQISTGEGKTLVVVAAAIFKGICNEKVDIITSSSVLAVRDAKDNADIYKLFGVKVSHNCFVKMSERKEAYSGSDVIYGTLSNFQRDHLIDEFYGVNIKGDRTFKNLFVDEVDSMVLDKGNDTLYLSQDIPGLNKLESVYLFIWKKVVLYSGNKDEHWEEMLTEAVLFDLHGTLSINNLKDILKVNEVEASEIFHWLVNIKVLNLKNVCLKSFADVEPSTIPEKYKQYKDKLTYIIKNILTREREIVVPKWLNNFIETHLNVWINNARVASMMEERQNYVLDVDRTASRADINPIITIIDKGTGTDQNNSEWEEALHQFLQLKHGCKLSPQSLKAIFISNAIYFKKYRTIFGLTGTLGSKVERDLLKTLYDVHFVNIPTAKQKRLTEIQPILCVSLQEWVFQIVDRTKALLLLQRSVLIICETIQEVNHVYRSFQRAGVSNVVAYTREYEEAVMTEAETELGPGHVIIATNLAGRGTDIKINQALNDAGGLHVLLTYLASNMRIELQAFGRAARSGCNGSAQLVIQRCGSFLDMCSARDRQELQRITDINAHYVTHIIAEEKLFLEFTQVYRKLQNTHPPSLIKDIALERAISRWAYWLDENGMKLKEDTCAAQFKSFLTKLTKDFIDWSTWNNDPVYLLQLGVKYLESNSYRTAVKIFDLIITEESIFCEAAHYYKAAAYAMSLNFEKRPFDRIDTGTFESFLLELSEAERKFENRKDACNVASAFVQRLKESLKNSFVQIDAFKSQQENFVNIYDIFSKSIQTINGHAVCKSAFENPEVDDITSAKIYDGLIESNVLKKAHIPHANIDDLIDISTNYGISPNALMRIVKKYERIDLDENKFLEDLKLYVKLPTLEDFWDTLIRQQKLKKETVFVVVNKIKLTNQQEDLLQDITKLTLDTKLNNKKQVFMKRVSHINNASCYIFEINQFKEAIGSPLFEQLQQQGIITINKIAAVDKKECKNRALNEYDYVKQEHFLLDNIPTNETADIFKILTEKGTIKEATSKRYRFIGKYDETNLNNIRVYNQSVVNIFRMQFAYQIALEQMLDSLRESDTPVFIDLITEPHTNLMWNIIEKNIIEPVRVHTHEKTNIANIIVERCVTNTNIRTSVSQHVNNVLSYMVSSLKKFVCPVFKLVPIEEYFNQLQPSLLEEFTACKVNGLSFILTAEEKKWTTKMICNTFTVMLFALIQIAIGLVIELLTLGIATHIGGFILSEGVGDLIYTVSCWKTGYFSWDSYKSHKIQSMTVSVMTAGIGAFMSYGARLSRFGRNIFSSGVTAAGEDIAQMAGRELIENVGLKKVCVEVGRSFTLKSSEGILKGIANIGVDYMVESYLRDLCTTLSDAIMSDIEDAVTQHPINRTLGQLYRSLGPAISQERVMFYTDKMFSETHLLNESLSSLQKMLSAICSGFADATTKNINAKSADLMPILNIALHIAKFTTPILDIRQSVGKLLDYLNNQMHEDIIRYRRPNQEIITSPVEQDNFKFNIIATWGDKLKENAQVIFAKHVIKPAMDKCLHMLLIYSYKKCRTAFKDAQTLITRNKFNNKKQELAVQLNDEDIHPEVKTILIHDYQEALVQLRSTTRDYNLYADLVSEEGYMDPVCLQSCVNMFEHSQQMSSRTIVILVDVQDTGITEEYRSDYDYGVGEPHVIRLKFENNHYTNMNSSANVLGYDCLYHALVPDLPELETMGPVGFRQSICNTIRTNTTVQRFITKGHHSYAISKRSSAGIVNKSYSTKQIHDKLIISDTTVSTQTTNQNQSESEVANSSIPNSDYIGNPVNAIMNTSGGLTFVNDQHMMAASTINDSQVSIDLRLFGKDELMLETLLHHRQGANIATHLSSFSQKIKTTVGVSANIRLGNRAENTFAASCFSSNEMESHNFMHGRTGRQRTMSASRI